MPADEPLMPPPIRAMTAEDRHAVIGLLLGSEPWKRLGHRMADWDRYFAPIPAGRESYVLPDDAGVVAAIAVVRRHFLLGDYLELFGVAARARGRGVGSRLLEHVESLVFARATNLFICVSDFNQPARRFYRRHGYQEIGPLPNLLIDGSAEILLRKTTGPGMRAEEI
ncbi:putative N-acetyltransferase [Nitrospira sp. KM1]|uniref:GNAT family N-acetyltransferase n=1 Tax=Nitrospira sp. KM1 TaxID=1936990 RepID=UPI0013A73A16|nr:GNAT family N-acetyltransferase [Nitrospira sp. KM1]BCA55739.1 putative N-acetyltransferase [Nitrospira sp. KM1]